VTKYEAVAHLQELAHQELAHPQEVVQVLQELAQEPVHPKVREHQVREHQASMYAPVEVAPAEVAPVEVAEPSSSTIVQSALD